MLGLASHKNMFVVYIVSRSKSETNPIFCNANLVSVTPPKTLPSSLLPRPKAGNQFSLTVNQTVSTLPTKGPLLVQWACDPP